MATLDKTFYGDQVKVGPVRVVRPTIAVQATPDYSDGDTIGGLVTLSDFARRDAGSGLIMRFTLRSKIDITVSSFIHIFDQNPSASTFTDNAALVIHADDAAKILKTITVASTDWADPKGGSPWYTAEVIGPGGILERLGYQLPTGKSLYFVPEADGTINFSATTDWSAIIEQLQD